MKRLIRSLVIASGGLFLAATASNAASISFRPTGTQLDQDKILDFSGNPGDIVEFEILIDTNGINLNSNFNNVVIQFALLLDPTELRTINFPIQTDESYPENYFQVNFSTNTTTSIARVPIKMLESLINDGTPDLRLRLDLAYTRSTSNDGRGQDVTNLFEVGGGFGSEQTLDFQPVDFQQVPEPTTIFGSALALSVGGWLKRKKSSQQKKTTPQN